MKKITHDGVVYIAFTEEEYAEMVRKLRTVTKDHVTSRATILAGLAGLALALPADQTEGTPG